MTNVTAGQRPHRLVVVLGTGTEVGKTWCAARLLERLRELGVRVAARKPAQSFQPGEGPTDAEVLAAASGEDPHAVCPEHRWYPVPLAPPMAAEHLGRAEVRADELVDEVTWPEGIEVGIVETAGGARSPLAHDADSLELARLLRPERVVLVADAGLGTINSVRLAAEASAGLPLLVHLNRFDPSDDLHRRNEEWLVARDGCTVTTTVAALAEELIRGSE